MDGSEELEASPSTPEDSLRPDDGDEEWEAMGDWNPENFTASELSSLSHTHIPILWLVPSGTSPSPRPKSLPPYHALQNSVKTVPAAAPDPPLIWLDLSTLPQALTSKLVSSIPFHLLLSLFMDSKTISTLAIPLDKPRCFLQLFTYVV